MRYENGGQSARKPVPAGPSADSFAPFGALGCAKQLDTQVMAYISSIDNRRVWIADEETGLVFGLSHFRHAMDKTEWPTFGVPGVPFRKIDYKPFDLPAVHIFKIYGRTDPRGRGAGFPGALQRTYGLGIGKLIIRQNSGTRRGLTRWHDALHLTRRNTSCKRLNKLFSPLAAALALGGIAKRHAPASATIQVSSSNYGDLNLDPPAASSSLHKRIRNAARIGVQRRSKRASWGCVNRTSVA